ncbi:MAG: hypothetical protein IJQ47_08460 [Synergistaceae bacterium]|nr:hypothetical protein [Synergistaceae bacterium]
MRTKQEIDEEIRKAQTEIFNTVIVCDFNPEYLKFLSAKINTLLWVLEEKHNI